MPVQYQDIPALNTGVDLPPPPHGDILPGKTRIVFKHIFHKKGFALPCVESHMVDKHTVADHCRRVSGEVKIRHRLEQERIIRIFSKLFEAGDADVDLIFAHTRHNILYHFPWLQA